MLSPGVRLGPFEILAPAGAGGMGEVYRARDTRLDRTVAVKVLHADRLSDPNMRARFEREARTIASLSHPHICQLHDVGHQDGLDYLVMEFLEGETLAARLARIPGRGVPLPPDETLRYAIEIAGALAEAHQQGIVHRDLKPGNVMLTRNGVKLLDFGLARLAATPSSSDDAPTLAPMPDVTLTEKGSILGTWPYMAPEQVEGRSVDARSDIFAFGAVLYEMATGRRAFAGESHARLVAAILERDPDPFGDAARAAAPALERVVRKCLAKRPEARWQSAADLAEALKWIDEERRGSGVRPAEVNAHAIAPARRRALPWIAAVVAAASLGAVLGAIVPRGSDPAPAPVRRFVLESPADHRMLPGFAVAPDGRALAYEGDSAAGDAIYLRSFDQFAAQRVAGTEGGYFPTFSPDGRSLAFLVGNRLRRISLAAGASPVTVGDVTRVIDSSVAWLLDNSIVVGEVALDESKGGLLRFAADGGTPQRLTTPDRSHGEIDHHTPRPLPGGKAILITRHRGAEAFDVGVVLLETGEVRTIVSDGFDPRYLPTGHLLYARGGSLLAAPFDLDRLEVTGPEVVIVDQVRTLLGNGAARYDLGGDGTLVLVPPATGRSRRLAWVGGSRPIEVLPLDGRTFVRPSLSPDGTRVAVQVDEGTRRDIYLHDLRPGGTLTRLTNDGVSEAPQWTSDGSRVVFSRIEQGRREVYWQPANTLAPAERLVADDYSVFAGNWSPDGQALAFSRQPPTDQTSVALFDVKERRATQLVGPEEIAYHPQISPDGRWLAYASGKAPRTEVFVVAVQGGAARQITTEGGTAPRWRADGRVLYYRRGNAFLAVDVSQFPGALGKTDTVAQGIQVVSGGLAHPGYDLGKDGRLLIVQPGEEDRAPVRFEVVLNWHEELKQRVPVK